MDYLKAYMTWDLESHVHGLVWPADKGSGPAKSRHGSGCLLVLCLVRASGGFMR